MEDKREITKKEGLSRAFNLHCPFFELSAKTSTQAEVEIALKDLITEIRRSKRDRQIALINSNVKRTEKPSVDLSIFRKVGMVNMTMKNSFRGWKKTWIGLDQGILYFFFKEKVTSLFLSHSKDYKLRIPSYAEYLESCVVTSVRPPKETKKDRHFYIELARKGAKQNETILYYFQLDKEEECLDWLNLLEYNANLFAKRAMEKTRMSKHEEGNELQKKELQQMPSNDQCAECCAAGMTQVSTHWSS